MNPQLSGAGVPNGGAGRAKAATLRVTLGASILGVACAAVVTLSAATAAPVMHVHDGAGVLGTVDVATGAVTVIGNMGVVLTDIGFDPAGNLYGVSFTNFYSINAATAATTLIGGHGVPGANALVFDAAGTAYAAGFGSTNLYTINPGTGAGTLLGDMGFASGGDLAFLGGALYLANSASQLVKVDLANLANTALIGSFGVGSVFGLASGDDGKLYAVASTTVYTVNVTTGAATNPVSFNGQGLGGAFGQGFYTEAGATPVPEPAALALFGCALAGLGLVARWRPLAA